MRMAMSIVFVGLLTCCAPWVSAGEKPDAGQLAEMKNCAVCCAMAEHPELLGQMTRETHKIDNGMICVSSVPKEQVKDFMSMHEKMMKNVEKVKAEIQRGDKVKLCSYCESMGDLHKAGATQQSINTTNGVISLFTSSDPEVVKKIHSQADKAIALQKQLH